jgi:hypothetical protein
LSPLYAGFLVFAWQAGVPTAKQASLVPIAVPSGPGLYVMATILGTCVLSVVVTHLHYLCFVRKEIGALINWLRQPVEARSTLQLAVSSIAPQESAAKSGDRYDIRVSA